VEQRAGAGHQVHHVDDLVDLERDLVDVLAIDRGHEGAREARLHLVEGLVAVVLDPLYGLRDRVRGWRRRRRAGGAPDRVR
jgi:hypothetical protein